MKQQSIHTKASLTSLRQLTGGGKFCLGRGFHKFRLSTFLFILTAAFLLTSCEKEVTTYPELQAFYQESCQLPVATADSVSRFAHKVDQFVGTYPAALGDPLYPQIQENIQKSWFRIKIDINTEWDGETYFDLDGNLLIPTEGEKPEGDASEAASRSGNDW